MTTGDERPAADRLEQQAELDPDEEPEDAPATPGDDLEAPDADLVEQRREVPADEDDDPDR